MAAVIAQVAADTQPLAQYGLLGAVLAWFMFHGSKLAGEIRSLAHRIDGLTKAMLMDMVNRDNVGFHTKQAARDSIARIEAREAK